MDNAANWNEPLGDHPLISFNYLPVPDYRDAESEQKKPFPDGVEIYPTSCTPYAVQYSE